MRPEPGKQFTGEVGGSDGIVGIPSPNVIIQQSVFRISMNMGQTQVHAVSLDGICDPTDKRDRSVCILLFDNPDMGQVIIRFPVSIVIPCVVEENQIAGTDDGSVMQRPVLLNVVMNHANAVGTWIDGTAFIEVNPISQKNGPSDARAIVLDPASVDLDRTGPHEMRGTIGDRGPADGGTAGLAAGFA